MKLLLTNRQITEKKMRNYLSEKQLTAIYKLFCWFHGIKLGKRYIHYQSGFTDRDGGGIVCYGEVKDFLVCKVTKEIVTFYISIHLYNHNSEFAKEMDLKNVFIQRDYYNWGAYTFKQIKSLIKAQDMLKSNFTALLKPF